MTTNRKCFEKPPVFISVEGCMGVLEELGRHILWVTTGILSLMEKDAVPHLSS